MSVEPLPTNAYIPGGPFPRPEESDYRPETLRSDSTAYLHGFSLFNAGFYWEAHEVWECLWHGAGRVGPVADLLRGLIKLAAAGVKVRQNQRHGVVTHATRAAAVFDSARAASSTSTLLGMDLIKLAEIARSLAESPPSTESKLSDSIVRIFDFTLLPNESTAHEA